MKVRLGWFAVACLCLVSWGFGQNAAISSASVSVPPVIQFSNVAVDEGGTPLSGTASITFSLYNTAVGGQALWTETQNVQLGSAGQYSVYLGLTQANGLLANLFTSGQAQWLGVKIEGQPEQPRVFLVSVPYAMKAGDAATIGGLPPSAFVMAAPPNANAGSATSNAAIASPAPATSSDVTTSGGTLDYIPLWDAASDITSSVLCSSENAFLGFAANNTTTGSDNTAAGAVALGSNTTGGGNTSVGALSGLTSDGSAIAASANSFFGYEASLSTGSLNNATTIGAYAVVGEGNALVLGSGGDVGIGTSTPAAPLHINGPAAAPPSGEPSGNSGLLLGTNGTASYKWIQSYGGVLALNPVNNHVGIGTTAPDTLLSVNGGADKPGGGSWGTQAEESRWQVPPWPQPDHADQSRALSL